jgi:hypothetical protein
MSEVVARARKVFEVFRKAFDEHHGSASWMQSFDESDRELLGMQWGELEGALDFLKRKGLIESVTDGAYQLTDVGVDACVDAEFLNEVLPP